MESTSSSSERARFQALLETAARAMVRGVMENMAHTRYVEDREIALLTDGIRNGLLQIEGNECGYTRRT